ncbi:hypothetical protein TD95_000168 [Thielaviopsis punctulata]|uniref:HIT domain-containing protein n=1 Tax=Thielaviopsis punctulata TaxID=72032 RepID=A0A0F4ZEQ0_9PEZI|nr:hypothetical protein TD95_000168 [Thielaviopsis punctulata]
MCPFCAIASSFPPYDPHHPPSSLPSPLSPTAFVLLSTPSVIAFLDIMPLSTGHLLLSPRRHAEKFTDVQPAEAAELGRSLLVMSKALARATGVHDWNIVQNNGAAAAQVVPHVHFHVIPRPEIRASGRMSESFTMFGRGTRQDLDEDEAEELARRIRQEVAKGLIESESKL